MTERARTAAGDLDRLLGRDALGDAVERAVEAARPSTVVGGWATVELDRAEREVRAANAALGAAEVRVAADDELLGARCRILHFPEQGDGTCDVVLLEPSTEGRLAASLVRYGEGRVALYLVAAPDAAGRLRAAGFSLSGAGAGPLGRQRAILVGGRWGPHLLLVEDPAATIRP